MVHHIVSQGRVQHWQRTEWKIYASVQSNKRNYIRLCLTLFYLPVVGVSQPSLHRKYLCFPDLNTSEADNTT